MNMLVPIIYTIVGGFLGFCGALILEQHKRRQLEKDFKEGVCAELRETLPQFVNYYYLLNQALGKIDRDMLNWTYSMFSALNGESSGLIEKIENLLKLSDNQLAALSLRAKDPKTTAMSLKKFNLSFLEESITSFSLLDSPFRCSVLAIRTKINQLNQEIDLYNFFYERTFASGLTQKNWLNLDNNIKKSYEHIAQMSRKIAEMMKELIL